jgi:hypothetical protein
MSLQSKLEDDIHDRLIQIGRERDASILDLFDTFRLTSRFKKSELGEEYTGRETRILVIAYYDTINNYKYGRKSIP